MIVFATSEVAHDFVRQRFLDGDDELPDRLNRGPLARLERLQHLVGQLCGPVDDAGKTAQCSGPCQEPQGSVYKFSLVGVDRWSGCLGVVVAASEVEVRGISSRSSRKRSSASTTSV